MGGPCDLRKEKLREPYSVTHILTGACVRGDRDLEAARRLAQ
jgi:hypothetical protein